MLEGVAHVDHVEGDPQTVRHAPGVAGVVGAAAGPAPAGGLRVGLDAGAEVDPDHLRARAEEAGGGDGAVDASGEGGEDPHGVPIPPRRRIGLEFGGMRLGSPYDTGLSGGPAPASTHARPE